MVSESQAGPGISSSRHQNIIPNQLEQTSACRVNQWESMHDQKSKM